MNYSTDFKSIRNDAAQEWQARTDLAACYRPVDQYGMADLIHNHITGPIPSTERLLLRLLAPTEKSSGYPPYWH